VWAIRKTLSEYHGKTVSVISPYQAKIDLFKHYHRHDIDNVEYLTIDSVQGRDFDIVLLSLVDPNCPFVNQRNLLNVAATRGKEKTIIFGKRPYSSMLLHTLYQEIHKQLFPELPAAEAFPPSVNHTKKNHKGEGEVHSKFVL